jgi:tRNA(Arg) A34 adenosine deaminase TadA
LASGIPTVVYGATVPKTGAAGTLIYPLTDEQLNCSCCIMPGVLTELSGAMLSRFLEGQR